MSAAVETKGLVVQYGDDVVLNGLDLSVREGEFVCVLGPSGCGKSTLLRIFGDLISGQGGTVTVYGESPRDCWERLAYVFQTPRLVRWRSAMDNVVLGMELRGINGSKANLRERSRRYLEILGLSDLADRPAHVLSGGEQQRVAIARALAIDPQILVLDEPFSALDVQTRRQLRKEVVSLWRETGLTIVFVTHDVEEALIIGSRVVVLSPKPTSILADISVELPHPRNRAEPKFVELRHQIISLFAGMEDLDLEGGDGLA